MHIVDMSALLPLVVHHHLHGDGFGQRVGTQVGDTGLVAFRMRQDNDDRSYRWL